MTNTGKEQVLDDRLGHLFSDRDRGLFFIRDRDLEAQLIAIKSLLRRNREAEEETFKEIQELDETIQSFTGDDQYRMYLEGHWVDALQASVFQDAAHSMSAVGMLGPFIESLFVAIFDGLRKRDQSASIQDPRTKATQDQFWNPQIVFGKDGPREDIVAGIVQLANATGLQSFMPGDYQKTLAALFSYRNNMFHNGFEWSLDVRQKFANRIKNDSWPIIWFSQATRDDQPWVFYMSDLFIENILRLIDQVLEGVGKYTSENLEDKLPCKKGEK